MKKLSCILLILLLLCGCNVGSGDSTVSHAQITINLPTDDTVNSYRTESRSETSSVAGNASLESTSSMPDKIPTDEVKPSDGSTQSSSQNITAAYIGNKNSRVFHKPDCTSAEKMKPENKVSFKSKDAALSDGYSPCKRCNP